MLWPIALKWRASVGPRCRTTPVAQFPRQEDPWFCQWNYANTSPAVRGSMTWQTEFCQFVRTWVELYSYSEVILVFNLTEMKIYIEIIWAITVIPDCYHKYTHSIRNKLFTKDFVQSQRYVQSCQQTARWRVAFHFLLPEVDVNTETCEHCIKADFQHNPAECIYKTPDIQHRVWSVDNESYLGRFKGEVAKLWNQAQQGQVKAENKSNMQIAPT